MAQTLCIKCGSDLKPSSYCHLCQEPLVFAYFLWVYYWRKSSYRL